MYQLIIREEVFMQEKLQELENQVKKLIQKNETLKNQNQELFDSYFKIDQEKELLQAQHNQATTQIEALIERLKVLDEAVV